MMDLFCAGSTRKEIAAVEHRSEGSVNDRLGIVRGLIGGKTDAHLASIWTARKLNGRKDGTG